jgi:hypothetical protein
MRPSILAALSLWISLWLAPAAGAVLTPSGTTLWNLSAGDYQIAVEVYAGSSLGTLTLTNSLNGRSAVGSLYPAFVVDRPHGEIDELVADGYFQNETFFPALGLGEIAPGSNPYQGLVHLSLVDVQGVAFDGALPGFVPGQFLLPVDQPPLSAFETSAVVITHYEFSSAIGGYAPITQTLTISGVPEPGLAPFTLLAPLVGLLASRRQGAGTTR